MNPFANPQSESQSPRAAGHSGVLLDQPLPLHCPGSVLVASKLHCMHAQQAELLCCVLGTLTFACIPTLTVAHRHPQFGVHTAGMLYNYYIDECHMPTSKFARR